MAGFLDALRAFFDPPPALDYGTPIGRVVNLGREERGLWTVWGTSEDQTGNTIAGVQVSAETAMHAPAVWACVRLISGAIAGLPLHAYRGQGEERKQISLPFWIDQPIPQNPNVTRAVHIQQVVTSLLLEGNAFIRFLPSVSSPIGMVVLPPHDVVIKTEATGDVFYEWNHQRLTPAEVVHIPYQVVLGQARGLNPIDAAKESIGLALAADQFGSAFFGNGATPGGFIKFPLGAEPDAAEITRLKKDFQRKYVGARQSFAVGALTGGAEWQQNETSNRDSQFLELREFQVEDIGRLYGVPPHMIGSQKPGAVAYASVEQRNIDFVTHGLQPVIEKLEDGYERVLRGQRTYFKFNIEGLLRGDQQSRAAYYAMLLDKKVVRREEVRAKEDLPFDPEGVGYLETPNNNPPQEPTEPSEDDGADRQAPVQIIANGIELEPPTVNVTTPDVRVEAPIVNVDTSPFADAIRSHSEAISALAEEIRRPREREVIRDARGKITGVREK